MPKKIKTTESKDITGLEVLKKSPSVWDEKVVKAIEQNSFYYGGEPLFRSSDKYIIQHLQAIDDKATSVLDYACGTGRLYDLMKRHGVDLKYVGFDTSQDMLNRFAEKFPDANIYNDFDKCITENEIDILINIDMLQHSESIEDFKNKFDALVSIPKSHSLIHFWYSDRDFYQVIPIYERTFYEYFPSKETIEDVILKGKEGDTLLFRDCKPYKTAVITVKNQ